MWRRSGIYSEHYAAKDRCAKVKLRKRHTVKDSCAKSESTVNITQQRTAVRKWNLRKTSRSERRLCEIRIYSEHYHSHEQLCESGIYRGHHAEKEATVQNQYSRRITTQRWIVARDLRWTIITATNSCAEVESTESVKQQETTVQNQYSRSITTQRRIVARDLQGTSCSQGQQCDSGITENNRHGYE